MSSDPRTWGSVASVGKMHYDRSKRAKVIPWMDSHHTAVGFAYKYDDPGTPDRLIYMFPGTDGWSFFIHVTDVHFDERFPDQVRMRTPIDPENDRRVASIYLDL